MSIQQTSLSSLVSALHGQGVLLTGPPGTRKQELAHRWMLEGLRAGDTAVFVCIRTTAQNVLRELNALEPVGQYLDAGQLKFIDMVAARDTLAEIPPNTTKLQGVTDLMGLSGQFDRYSRENPNARFLIDPVSFLLLYNNPAFAVDMLQTATIRMASRNQTLLMINHEGVLSDQLNATLEALSTTVFESAIYEVDGNPSSLLRVKFGPTRTESGWIEII